MRKNLLKSVGVIALALVGTVSAKADLIPTTTVYDFEDGNAVFTARSRMEVKIANDTTLGSNVLTFVNAKNAQNGYGFANYNFSDLTFHAAQVKLDFDYQPKENRGQLTIGDGLVRGNDGGCSKNTYGAKGAIFRIGTDKSDFFINDAKQAKAGIEGSWLHVTVTVYNFERKVEWTVLKGDSIISQSGTTEGEGEEAIFTPGKVDFWKADANECTQIDVFGFINNSTETMIDNLSITSIVDTDIKFWDYTIKYVDAEGNELKEARTSNGREGTHAVLLASDKDPIRINNDEVNMKYVYESDDAETVAIAENAVITVKFREAEVYAGVLNCMIDGQSGTDGRLAQYSGFTFFEGDTYNVYPSRGYGKDGVYYFTPATSYNGVTFTFPGSLNTRNINGVVTYIGQLNYAAVDSVAYYSDIERLALPVEDEGNGTGLGQLEGTVNSWWSFSGGIFDRFSQGRGIRLDEGSYVWTEPITEAASYKVTVYGRNDYYKNGEARTEVNPFALGLIGDDGTLKVYNVAVPDWTSSMTGAVVVENISIPANGKLAIVNTNTEGGQISLDDISLTKTGDYVEPDMVTTDIKTVEVKAQNNGIIYNLAGQAVKNAQKGIFIINGKKVVK